MKITPNFLVQQEQAADEQLKLINSLFASGKCQIDTPPDCFIWSGTVEELKAVLGKHEIKLNEGPSVL